MSKDKQDFRDSILESISLDNLPSENRSLTLLASAKDGDDEALQELLARYQDRLHRIVRIQLGDSPLRQVQDSMDVVQSTFLAALPKIKDLEYRSAASLLHWFSRISLNQIRDAYSYQQAARRDQRRTVPLPSSAKSQGGDIPVRESTPLEQAELDEIRELLGVGFDIKASFLP